MGICKGEIKMNKEIGLRLVELVEKELKNSSNEVKETAKELEEELKKVKDNSITQEKEIIEEITYISVMSELLADKCVKSGNFNLISLYTDNLKDTIMYLTVNVSEKILKDILKPKKENTKSDYSEKE